MTAQLQISPPESSLNSMLSYMEDLSSLYTEELNAIGMRDMKRFAEIQPLKNRLVQDFESRMAELKTQPSLIKTIRPELRERILLAENTLSQLAKKSQRECKIRSESLRRVQQRLLDAARFMIEKDQKKYNSRGQASMSQTRPVATAINEAI